MVRTRVFVLCEKSTAARKIAQALRGTDVRRITKDGFEFYCIRGRGMEIIVFPVQGHLFSLYDTMRDRSTYPVFDLEWAPIRHKSKRVSKLISLMKEEAQSADRFINACDYDIEGETIGYNVLRYVCGCEPDGILRMKFSSLTDDELRNAFENAKPMNEGFALAGRARHLVDFIWGINLSRVLTQAYIERNAGYRTFSIGRVQGATLFFIYQRECEIRSFVPRPYWVLLARFSKDGKEFLADFEKQRIFSIDEAKKIVTDCSGKKGIVRDIDEQVHIIDPPPPFNLGDLQKASYQHFGLSPSKTLQIAENLYLRALISYPRTNSQRLPNLDFTNIIRKLSTNPIYREASKLLGGKLQPKEGKFQDTAHPAIYPTGELPEKLTNVESNLYDLIVRRFLASFADPCKKLGIKIMIKVDDYTFILRGASIKHMGWIEYYGKYASMDEVSVPMLKVNDEVLVEEILCQEKYVSPPRRYNQASLLDKMERENIGTKSTRSEIISTLYRREYVKGSQIELSPLGFAVVEAMLDNVPEILDTHLTRSVEKDLEMIENKPNMYSDVVFKSTESLLYFLPRLKKNESGLGQILHMGARAMFKESSFLGICPVCSKGSMMLMRSRKTGKRFVGCDNYKGGCRASAPLPQKGSLNFLGNCEFCKWPIVESRMNRSIWRFCVNINCESRRMRNELQSLQQKSN
jgi:DNA topoisomerase-1